MASAYQVANSSQSWPASYLLNQGVGRYDFNTLNASSESGLAWLCQACPEREFLLGWLASESNVWSQNTQTAELDVAILFGDPKLQTFYEKAGWEGLPGASTRIGTPEESEENDGLRMMLFLSWKGKAGYPSLIKQPMYNDDPW